MYIVYLYTDVILKSQIKAVLTTEIKFISFHQSSINIEFIKVFDIDERDGPQ